MWGGSFLVSPETQGSVRSPAVPPRKPDATPQAPVCGGHGWGEPEGRGGLTQKDPRQSSGDAALQPVPRALLPVTVPLADMVLTLQSSKEQCLLSSW